MCVLTISPQPPVDPSGGGEKMPLSRGDVQAIHPPRHHCWREEIVAQKKSQSIADSILVAWNDGRMGNRQTKRMTKQRRHRKPISKAAHHRDRKSTRLNSSH